MSSSPKPALDGHILRTLHVSLVNDSSHRIDSFDCAVTVPRAILDHDSANYGDEVTAQHSEYRRFKFNEKRFQAISPRDGVTWDLPYCITCGNRTLPADFLSGLIASEKAVEVRAYVDGVEYKLQKTIKQLSVEAYDG